MGDLKALCIECDALLDENSQKAELISLDSQLCQRPGLNVELNLRAPSRKLIFRGDLVRAGATRFTWLETHAILFDHYLVLSKIVTRQDPATGLKREIYDVSKLVSGFPLTFDLCGANLN